MEGNAQESNLLLIGTEKGTADAPIVKLGSRCIIIIFFFWFSSFCCFSFIFFLLCVEEIQLVYLYSRISIWCIQLHIKKGASFHLFFLFLFLVVLKCLSFAIISPQQGEVSPDQIDHLFWGSD